MTDKVDPRLEADAQIARALQIVVDANPDDLPRGREYTPDELETLFFALGTAMTQLAKVPGGKEARERFYHNCQDQLLKRGRTDIIEELAEEKKRHELAKELVKRALGDNVDLSPGTGGYAALKLFERELHDMNELRRKIDALAVTMTY